MAQKGPRRRETPVIEEDEVRKKENRLILDFLDEEPEFRSGLLRMVVDAFIFPWADGGETTFTL